MEKIPQLDLIKRLNADYANAIAKHNDNSPLTYIAQMVHYENGFFCIWFLIPV